MTMGEKIRHARIALNLTQAELAAMTGLTPRAIYSYEQMGIMPRRSNFKKLAETLNMTTAYLIDDDAQDPQHKIDEELFLANVKNEYGVKGAREATEVLERASALFAGGELNDEAKDIFFQSLMEIYLESKAEARAKFTPKKYRKKSAEKSLPDDAHEGN
jgi:transcriptional regulator with XRE-family HTH domain